MTDRFEISRQDACASYQDQWCAPAQSKESPCRNSAGEAGRHHRLERLGKIVSGLRYSLRRRPAPLRREPFRLRPAIPRSDGKAGRRFYRRSVPGHRYRAAQRRRQSEIDHRDDDRNLRLSASSFLRRRPTPRSGNRQPVLRQTPQQIVDQILAYPTGNKIILLAPLVQNQNGEFRDVIEKLKREGFVRVRIDGEIVELDRPEPIRLKKGSSGTRLKRWSIDWLCAKGFGSD